MGKKSIDNVISRDGYPNPRLKIHRGVWTVFVSIPRSIRHLFGKKGVTTEMRRVAGMCELEARKSLERVSHDIYRHMDLVQEEALRKKELPKKVLKQQPKSFETQMQKEINFDAEVIALKFVETFSSILAPNGTSSNSILVEKANFQKLSLFKRLFFLKRFKKLTPFEALSDLKDKSDILAHMVKNNPERYTKKEQEIAQSYLQPKVKLFLEGLIADTAKESSMDIPKTPDQIEGDPPQLAHENGFGIEEFPAKSFEKNIKKLTSNHKSMSDLRSDYLCWIQKHYKDKSSVNKIRLGFDEFISLMGDLDPKNINPNMAVVFAERQLDEHINRSHQTIKDRNWAMGVFTDFCYTKRYMTTRPFFGAKLKKYGSIGGNWLEYQDSDLDRIFRHSWEKQELLLLKIGLATGMRIGEIALLTWEQIKETSKFQYISLFEEPEEFTLLKNIGSTKFIPIHPDLKFPKMGEGRIFNYPIDAYGRASTSAGRSVNAILSSLVENSFRKSFHSLRTTFIVKMQEAGSPAEIRKLITGRGMVGEGKSLHNGDWAQALFDSVRQLDLPWLKYEP